MANMFFATGRITYIFNIFSVALNIRGIKYSRTLALYGKERGAGHADSAKRMAYDRQRIHDSVYKLFPAQLYYIYAWLVRICPIITETEYRKQIHVYTDRERICGTASFREKKSHFVSYPALR